MWCSTMMAVLPGTRLYLQLSPVLISQFIPTQPAIMYQLWVYLRIHPLFLEGVIGRTYLYVSVLFHEWYYFRVTVMHHACLWFVNVHILTIPAGSPEGVLLEVSETGSVRVSWGAVEDTDYYTVSFSQAVGDDQEGLCRDDSHSARVTVREVLTASIAVTITLSVTIENNCTLIRVLL